MLAGSRPSSLKRRRITVLSACYVVPNHSEVCAFRCDGARSSSVVVRRVRISVVLRSDSKEALPVVSGVVDLVGYDEGTPPHVAAPRRASTDVPSDSRARPAAVAKD